MYMYMYLKAVPDIGVLFHFQEFLTFWVSWFIFKVAFCDIFTDFASIRKNKITYYT